MLDAAFGGSSQALSASSLSQAEMPFDPAFRLYMDFSAAVQRKCTCLVPLSLAGKGGLPRFLGVMGPDYMPTQISCNLSLSMI